MTSFVYQLQKEQRPPASPLISKEPLSGTNSSVRPGVRTPLLSSINRNADNLKRSIKLEDRGITYGKLIESSRKIDDSGEQIRKPKIDCSRGPSDMVQSPPLLLVSSYVEVNPEKAVKQKSQPDLCSKSQVDENERPIKTRSLVFPVNGEAKPQEKKEGNSSAIREKKSKPEVEWTPYVLLAIIMFLIFSFKSEAGRELVDSTIIPFYCEWMYSGFFK